MGAIVSNPRKKFLFSLEFINYPVEPYLFQKCTLPEITIDQVAHGDLNRDVKTAGRVQIGNFTAEKLETTSGSDTWLRSWINSCQDHILGGGLSPLEQWDDIKVTELAEDGRTPIQVWLMHEVWPCKVNGQDLDRMASENTIESIEFSVGTVEKI